MNIYNGIVALGKDGSAEVTLPDWFEALNREFRYQLTCIGGFAPVYVAKKVNGNRFKIAGGKPGMEVSWQLTGVRKDAYAETHRVQVEEMKPVAERGSYLHPEAFGKSAEKNAQQAYEKAQQR
jgi:trimeric autotransporter adhesin